MMKSADQSWAMECVHVSAHGDKEISFITRPGMYICLQVDIPSSNVETSDKTRGSISHIIRDHPHHPGLNAWLHMSLNFCEKAPMTGSSTF